MVAGGPRATMGDALRLSPKAQSGTGVAYRMGDTVVHPQHGVATVQGIVTKGVGKGRTRFLQLVFASASLKILVPVDSIDAVGIRALPTKREAAAILAVLARPSDVPETWSERTASTSSRVKSRELAQAAMVVRDLTRHIRRSGKPLSSSENAVLQTCLNSVSSELSLVWDISHDDARAVVLEQARAEE